MQITMAHGGGGKMTAQLINSVFASRFSNPVLDRMEDAAVLPGSSQIAVTTDSFVVTPLFFPGGDIGRLSVCGTVNDLLMSGAVPKYLTCGFILEEGVELEDLERIASSMAQTAAEAGVTIVAGDTKVVEGNGGLFINTAGVGFMRPGAAPQAANCAPGDVVVLSGNLGEHHAAILSARMGIENAIASDCAPLVAMVDRLYAAGVQVKAMRDVTRGGLATILQEFARASSASIVLEEAALPISQQVMGFCGILGLDPLYMGNEGKMVLVVPPQDAQRAVEVIKQSPYGAQCAVIGQVQAGAPGVTMRTTIGGTRVVSELYGEGLPRIC